MKVCESLHSKLNVNRPGKGNWYNLILEKRIRQKVKGKEKPMRVTDRRTILLHQFNGHAIPLDGQRPLRMRVQYHYVLPHPLPFEGFRVL